ncbi:MAG: DNA repair protein RecN [Actinomycetales bacterium]|nr:DNA repair protein RecN [Actinomycetales bacterium]
MIEEISIRDLGVIGDAKLEFARGLTVLTGETGAGKTMVLSALGLLLGDRADSSSVRAGSEQSFVEGRWFFDSGRVASAAVAEQVSALLEESGIAIEGGELILNRSVSSEGRSRASANGRAVPVGLVSGLGQNLVVVHGQSDQLRLKSQTAQREALDRFAGAEFGARLSEYRIAFEEWRALSTRLESLTNESQAREREVAELADAVAVLETAGPKVGEYTALIAQLDRLTNIEGLRAAATASHEALSATEYGDAADALAAVGSARKALEPIADSDPVIAALVERLREIGYQISDIAGELSAYLADLDGDAENSIEALQARRAELSALGKRFACDPDELHEMVARFSARLLELDNSDVAKERLAAQLTEAESRARELAADLSTRRAKAAERLANEVTQELAGLAMANASLVVQVSSLGELRPHGFDDVAILLANRTGAEARPIAKGASGGELSRIMLAIEVVMAQSEQAPTFIFDEVDAGIGGSTAIEIGRRLAQLAQNAQVIVVTHLAQVAAFADRHLRVQKTHTGEVTSSDVVTLIGEDRVVELARMLSGLSDSESARENAQELLMLARQTV